MSGTASVSPGVTPRDTSRQIWIDLARGVGVILVVYGHVLGGLVRAEVFPNGPVAAWMDYTLYTFHMPLFFFLAGLNVEHSLRRGAKPFLAVKGWTIAYPYVLWSLIQGSIIMSMGSTVNVPITASDLAAIWYRPIGQFWFLYVLMICHVLATLMPSRRTLAALAGVGFGVFLLLPVRPDLSLTLHHLPFYVAGMYASRWVMNWRPGLGSGAAMLALVWLAFAGAVVFGGWMSDMDANGLASLPACVLGIAGVVLLCKLMPARAFAWLAAVGAMSMTIYILHILAGSGIRMVMLKLHVPPMPWLYLLAGTAAGVALPMLAHVILRRLQLLAAFGLAPRSPRASTPVLSPGKA